MATSRDFHLRVMEDADFRSGAIEIQWLERRLESLTSVRPPAETTRLAALVGALIADRDRARARTAAAPAGQPAPSWLRAGRLDAQR